MLAITPPTIDQVYLAWAIGSRRQRLDPDAVLEIPKRVATCPICGGKLYAHFEAWEATGKSSRWRCEEAKLDCESEPDICDPDYMDWLNGHYSMPYVDWLPLETELTRWVNRRYWFALD
jgi:hypothetical protein